MVRDLVFNALSNMYLFLVVGHYRINWYNLCLVMHLSLHLQIIPRQQALICQWLDWTDPYKSAGQIERGA